MRPTILSIMLLFTVPSMAQRAKVLEVEYERLKAINTNLPIPKAPKTSKAMHEAILKAAKTE